MTNKPLKEPITANKSAHNVIMTLCALLHVVMALLKIRRSENMYKTIAPLERQESITIG